MKVRHFGRFLPMSQVQLNSVNSRNSTLGQSILKTQVSEFVGRRGAFISAIFFVLVRGGDVDNSVPWYWQQLWQGLYNIISALPDWAELNEFHVITGSVCKQPHVTVQTTAWASISRSFFLFQSLPFIPSLAHLCGITRVDGDAYAHTHTHTRAGAHAQNGKHTQLHSLVGFLALSFLFIRMGVSLGSDVFLRVFLFSSYSFHHPLI